MRMTPLDIQNHRFARRISGYDTEEVDTYLQMAADDCESLTRENESLKDEVQRLERRVKELAETENVLRQTLVSAQTMSEELRKNAVRESEVLLGEAELRAERILDASHRRAARLSEDVRELRGLRKRLATGLRSTLHTHLAMVDGLDPENAESEVLAVDRRPRTRVAAATAPETSQQKSQPFPKVEAVSEGAKPEDAAVSVGAGPQEPAEPIVVAERESAPRTSTKRSRPTPDAPVPGGP